MRMSPIRTRSHQIPLGLQLNSIHCCPQAVSPENKGLRKADHFRHCSATSCSTNSTGSWSAGDIVSFAMRTIATSTFAANGRVNG